MGSIISIIIKRCTRKPSREITNATGYPIIKQMTVDIIASQNERTNIDANVPIAEKLTSEISPPGVVNA